MQRIIPLEFIKFARFDGHAEVWQMFNRPHRLGGCEIPPAALGCLTLFELSQNTYLQSRWSCNILDRLRVCHILVERHKAVEAVQEYCSTDDSNVSSMDLLERATEWDIYRLLRITGKLNGKAGIRGISALSKYDNTVIDWALKNGLVVTDWEAFDKWFDTASAAGAMMKSAASQSRPGMFTSETLAEVAVWAHEALGLTMEQAWWEVPLCSMRFSQVAYGNIFCGKKYKRPKDERDIERLDRELAERENLGQLHPWQILDCLDESVASNNKVSDQQLAANAFILWELEVWKWKMRERGYEAVRRELIDSGLIGESLMWDD